MAQTLVRFRESTFSPWGSRPRTRSGLRSPLPDASEKYSCCIGSISTVNQILSDQGLQYPSELPPLVLLSANEDLMAHGQRRGKRAPVKKPLQPIKTSVVTVPALLVAPDDIPPPNEESKLVELASFPGYNPHQPTPLPHGMDPLEQMQRTSRAQTMLSVKREGFRETWKMLLYKSSSQAIFQDYFWWFFLHKYQNSKLLSVQNQLFNRISVNYVNLLCENVDLRWRDPFFKVYPDVIAQCVYSTFVHAYPASWNSFDDSFKSALITMISLWQVGTRPLITAWKKWNISILEPANHLRHLMREKSDEGSSGKSPRKKTFELDALLKESEKQAPKLDKALKSDSGKSVHISLSNFDEALAASLANEKIHISASKERLVKTQAQATREMLTKRTRTAETARAKPTPTGKMIPISSRQSSIETKQPAKMWQQQCPTKKPTTGKMRVPEYVKRSAPLGVKQVLEKSKVKKTTFYKQPLSSPEPTKNQESTQSMAAPPPRRISQLINSSAFARNATQTTQVHAPLKLPTQRGLKPPANPSPKKVELKQNGNKSADKSEGAKKNVWKDKAVAILKRNKESKAPVPVAPPTFEHVQFNVFGQSPLVKHFLKQRQLSHENETKVLTGRTELVDEADPDSESFQDVLCEAFEKAVTTYEKLEKLYQEQKKAMAKFSKARVKASRKHEEEVKTLLGVKNEVRQLSNELTAHILNEHGTIKGKMSIGAAILKTVNRLAKLAS